MCKAVRIGFARLPIGCVSLPLMPTLLTFSVGLNLLLMAVGVYYFARRPRASDTQSPTSPFYTSRADAFAALPVHEGAIIFAGDSLTEFARWDELLGREDVLNRGAAGDTVNRLASRVGEFGRHNPRVIFFMAGINDLWPYRATPEQVAGDYRRMLVAAKASAPQARIVVQGVLPTGVAGDLNARIAKTNQLLRDLSSEMGCDYLEVMGDLPPEFSSDGVHLNGRGYAVWAEVLSRYLGSP